MTTAARGFCESCFPFRRHTRDELPDAGESPEYSLPLRQVVRKHLNSIRVAFLLRQKLRERFRGEIRSKNTLSFFAQGEVPAQFGGRHLRQSSDAGVWVNGRPQLIIVMPPLIITMASPFICCMGAWLLIIA